MQPLPWHSSIVYRYATISMMPTAQLGGRICCKPFRGATARCRSTGNHPYVRTTHSAHLVNPWCRRMGWFHRQGLNLRQVVKVVLVESQSNLEDSPETFTPPYPLRPTPLPRHTPPTRCQYLLSLGLLQTPGQDSQQFTPEEWAHGG